MKRLFGRWNVDDIKLVRRVIVSVVDVTVLLIGIALFVSSVRRFAGDGQGTLAPWDPPRRLVASGPYRYVRNPMISGVIFITLGEALILRSLPHAAWALTFVLMNVIWIPLYEEPTLENTFGDDYREYKHHVRRFIPRLRPYDAPRGVDV